MWMTFVSGFFHIFHFFQGPSMLQYASVLHSFPWLDYSPFQGYVTFILFIHTYIHKLVDIWVCFHILPMENNAAINIYVQVFAWGPFFQYLEVETLRYMVMLCLTFWCIRHFLKNFLNSLSPLEHSNFCWHMENNPLQEFVHWDGLLRLRPNDFHKCLEQCLSYSRHSQ